MSTSSRVRSVWSEPTVTKVSSPSTTTTISASPELCEPATVIDGSWDTSQGGNTMNSGTLAGRGTPRAASSSMWCSTAARSRPA